MTELGDRQRIQRLQAALDCQASAPTRTWWENYLEGAIGFRGAGIAVIRRELAAWREAEGMDGWPAGRQRALALRLFEEPLAEDKLAGVLFLQYYLYDRLPWRELLADYRSLFARELIFDWNTCDWFCVRVLGPTIASRGLPCARAIAAWRRAGYLWQARASLVPFVKVIGEERYHPLIETAAATLIARQERFAKTAVGWVLRDLSRPAKPRVERFVQRHLADFSVEALRNATKYFPPAERKDWLARLTSAPGKTGA